MKTILIKNTRDPLCGFTRDELKNYLVNALRSRVAEAYLFGSFARGALTPDSDIDLLLVADTGLPFPVRGRLFEDLRDRIPSLEFFVYTPAEFASLTEDPSPGFWNSVVREMVRLL